ncbi:non-ribosomal peptide synthetase [Streptosporangium sp. NBC_01469]|uniref:non-ribosomal peptide synthetase n=1 Tax=Streptosporangium sp. NBC_01469 TaxID=2903898 RepID=UPI002E2A523B|nr:amino acid adenylation domain-containing protein [Streptosporangium sp. NBC_01469]
MDRKIMPVRRQTIPSRGGVGEPVPLTVAQRALWIIEQVHPGDSAYNVPVAVRLDGPLDLGALRRAVERVLARHDILRTTFPMGRDEPYQRIAPSPPFGPRLVDLTTESPDRRDDLAGELLRRWADEPFDVTTGPLVRKRLIRLDADRHILGVFLHQLVCDGPSLHLLFDELADGYAGAPEPPPLPVQFGDYAAWQRRQPVDAADLAWWHERLAGAPTTLELPADHLHPARNGAGGANGADGTGGAGGTTCMDSAGGTGGANDANGFDRPRRRGGANHHITLPGPLMAEVLALARRMRVTPFVPMIAAYAALLGRLTGARDLLIGTPANDRLLSELEPVIGFFVNTLPVRFDLSGDPSFAEVVRRTRETVMDMLSYQRVPFQRLVEELAPQRDLDRNPLVQALFSFEPTPMAEPRFGDLTASLIDLMPTGAKAGLDFTVFRAATGDAFDLTITYSTDLFDPGTVRSIGDRFHRLLAAVVAAPEAPLWTLPPLAGAGPRDTANATAGVTADASTDSTAGVTAETAAGSVAERPVVPAVFTSVGRTPAPRTLLDVLDETTARFPEAAALDDGRVRLDYASLRAEVEALAERLRATGVRRGDRVGVCVPSGTADLYVSILAVLAAGAAYVPVDADDPAERRELVFGEAGVRAVVGENRHIALTSAARVPDGPREPAGPGETARPGVDDDAWIIFTSGSSGTPKGVVATHRGAAAFVDAEAGLFLRDRPIGPGDRVQALLSAAFDASCEEMWLAWRNGACLVPAPRALVRTGTDLGPWIRANGITIISTLPTLASRWPSEVFDGVRLLILGGETCPRELIERLTAPGREVWNSYGPTEATVTSSATLFSPGDPVRIGLPLDGWDLAVVGPDGDPVGMGETGELVIGGVGLARYLDPAKDAEKYAPLPSLGWRRAYRSGDLVRAEPEGLVFVGRIDEQVKLGGRRVELGEVEAALLRLPGVSAAAAAVRTTRLGHQILVGYVVPGGGFDEGGARALLRRTMPAALVPRLAVVGDLPIRTSGKVDRDALPWPLPVGGSPASGTPWASAGSPAPTDPVSGDSQASSDSRVSTGPPAPDGSRASTGFPASGGGGRELTLRRIWQEVLELDHVGPHDNFFDLGGNSFSLAAVHARLTEVLGRRIPMVALFEFPTIAALSRHLDEQAAPGAGHPPGTGSAPGAGSPPTPPADAPRRRRRRRRAGE